MIKEYSIKLDIQDGLVDARLITFNQLNTNTCKLNFEIINDGTPIDLTSKRVTLTVNTPSGAIIEDALMIVDGVGGRCESILANDMITEVGSHHAEVSIYDELSTKLLTTSIFRYIVNMRLGEQNVQVDTRYSTLQELIFEVNDLKNVNIVNAETIKQIKDEVLVINDNINVKHDDVVIKHKDITSKHLEILQKATKVDTDMQATVAAAQQVVADKNVVVQAKEETVINAQQVTADKGIVESAKQIAVDKSDIAIQQATTATQQAQIATDKANLAGQELAKVTAEGTKQIGLVQTEGTRQVGLVTNEGVKQIALATAQADRATAEATKATEAAKTEANNKIGLNSVFNSSIFNFMENKVEQSGLIYTGTNKVDLLYNTVIDSGIAFDINNTYDITHTFFVTDTTLNQGNRNIVGVNSIYQSNGWFLRYSRLDGSVSLIVNFNSTSTPVTFSTNPKVVYNTINTVRVVYKSKQYYFYLNGLFIGSKEFEFTKPTNANIQFGNNAQGDAINGTSVFRCIYNKQLTPQEIQHNFTILNNSQSINALSVADKKLLLSTDTDHVTDRTGRTQEQINRRAYKSKCKEFTSTGGAITVPNAEEGYVLSGEIKGQTVKNYVKTNGSFSVTNPTPQNIYKTVVLDTSVDNTKPHTVICFIKKNTLDVDFKIDANWEFAQTKTISAGQTGVFKTLSSTSKINKSFVLYAVNATGTIEIDTVVLEGDYTSKEVPITAYIPFGLSSTQAVISNNGSLYPIYEPTIQGKTRILKAPKGTQNWVEIDASEERNTATYDYKLDSVGGNLGSTPSVYDYIDRARKVKVVNTKEAMLSGWNYVAGRSYMTLNLSDALASGDIVRGVSDTLEVTTLSGKKKGAIYFNYGNKDLVYELLDGETDTQAKFKLANSKYRYQLATPQEVPMTDEELKAYDEHKKVILLPFAEDKVTLNEDGSGTWNKTSNKITLNGTEPWEVTTWNNATDKATVTGYLQKSAYTSVDVNGKLFTTHGEVFSSLFTKDVEATAITTDSKYSLQISVLKSKLATQDAIGLKAWLQSNPINIIYQQATPIVTTIDKSIMPTIQTVDKINICQVESPVAPSSFKLTLPVEINAEQNAAISALQTAVALLQQQVLTLQAFHK